MNPLTIPDADRLVAILGPGEIPGLLRYGAPLVTLVSSQWRSTCPDCQRVDEGRWEAGRPVLCVSADRFSTYVADGNDDPRGSAWSHSHLALRLDLEPGRACAAWWLAQQVAELRARGTSASFDYCGRGSVRGAPNGSGSPGWLIQIHGLGRVPNPGWGKGPEDHIFVADLYDWPGYGGGASSCPTLTGLDPDDPRVLSDGSRWVDAEALRRLVLSTAGEIKNADQGGTQ